MKRNSTLTGIALSVALSAFLTGCGSSTATDNSSSNTQNQNNETTSIDGKAIDGYLQYATVCLDLNNDGYCQNTEPSTQTDDNGTFTLKLTEEAQQDPNFDRAMLLVYGGKDVDTGDDFTGKLLAPKEGETVMMTPVSTLVAKELQKELKSENQLTKEEIKAKIKAAKERVATALDIPTDALDNDPVQEQKRGNDDLIKKSLQLQKAVEALVAAEPDPTKRDARAEKIYEALADSLDDLDPQNRGIGNLLDKTFEKADRDEKVKALLGGERGRKLGQAAKSVAETIKARFEQSDAQVKGEDDFLKKVAILTKEDLQKIKVAVEEGNEENISGQISVGDAFTKPDFDWAAKFLSHDLNKLGIEPTPDLIEKLKALFPQGEQIKLESLFHNPDLLKNSEDPDIQDLYKKVEAFIAKGEMEEAQHDAEREQKVIPMTVPMTFYIPEGEGYGKVSLGSDNRLSYQRYKIQQDGTFAQGTDDGQRFILNNGQWITDAGDANELFTANEDGSITLENWKEQAYLMEGRTIAGNETKLPQYGISVTMPNDAKMYFLKIEKIDDLYTLSEPVKDYTTNSPLTSIPQLIAKQCGTSWFIGGPNGGLAFAPDETGKCDTTLREGELVHAYKDGNGEVHTDGVGGKWYVKEVGGIDVLVAKPYNTDRIEDDEGDPSYPIFAVKDGTLYRGDLEPKGTKHIMPAYNEAALNAITSTITDQWQTIQNRLPSFVGGRGVSAE